MRQIAITEQDLAAHGEEHCTVMLNALKEGRLALEATIDYIVANGKIDPKAVYAGAVTYLKLAGVVLCGWQMARALMIALDKMDSDPKFFGAKLITARFYAETVLPQSAGLAQSVLLSGANINRRSADMF